MTVSGFIFNSSLEKMENANWAHNSDVGGSNPGCCSFTAINSIWQLQWPNGQSTGLLTQVLRHEVTPGATDNRVVHKRPAGTSTL